MASQRLRRAPRNSLPKTPRPISYQEPSGRHLSRRYETSVRREGDIRKSNIDIQDFQDSTFISHSGLIPGQQLKGTSDEGPSSESPAPAFFPDTSVHPTEGFGYPLIEPTGNVLSSSLLSHFPATFHSSVPSPTFSPLPPLLSVIPSSSISTVDSSVSVPSPPTEDLPTANALDTSTQHRALLQNKLAMPVIILLAVASGCLFLGACIITKTCTARSRRRRLKPLLPVLEKAYPDEDDFECKGSSIFGGKEQFSPTPGRTSTEWSWVQYPVPSSQPSAQATMDDARNQGKYEQAFNNFVSRDPAAQYPFSSTGTHQFPTEPEPVVQQSQHAVTHSTESEPIVSVVKHPAQTPMGTVGLSLDGVVQGPVSVPDGYDVIERRRRSNSQRHEQKRRSSGVGSIIAYDGADVSSPIFEATFQPIATPVLSTMPAVAQEGRARVQSSYIVNRPFTRFSVLPETYDIGTATKVNLAHAHAHSIENEVNLTTQMSDDQRERQTEALAHALGLPSPRCEYVVCSPQPSLYPDDSTHTTDSSGPSSGSIVTMESGSSLSGSSNQSFDNLEKLSGVLENESTRKTKRLKKKTGCRDSDKPPRVPSPPPLPSLTQMGLEHTNPEAYSNYRSPTYSIYGLYDGERKSGMGY